MPYLVARFYVRVMGTSHDVVQSGACDVSTGYSPTSVTTCVNCLSLINQPLYNVVGVKPNRPLKIPALGFLTFTCEISFMFIQYGSSITPVAYLQLLMELISAAALGRQGAIVRGHHHPFLLLARLTRPGLKAGACQAGVRVRES